MGVKGREFFDLVDDCSIQYWMIQWVKGNRRGDNMLDLLFTTEPDLIEDLEITAPVAGSENLLNLIKIY